jgi:hypothetical protein
MVRPFDSKSGKVFPPCGKMMSIRRVTTARLVSGRTSLVGFYSYRELGENCGLGFG